MDWQQMLGFFQVARTGSFTQAAEATLRTQSAVSQQVRALEEELGCTLLERTAGRMVSLTPAGERVRDFVAEVLDRREEMLSHLDGLADIAKGRLSIAAPFTTIYELLPGLIKAYRREFPQVDLSVLDRPQREVVKLVREGGADLGLALESAAPDGLTAVRWLRVEPALMLPRGHALAGGRPPTLAQIAAHPLILPPRAWRIGGPRGLEGLLKKAKLDYQVIMESANAELTARFVAEGLGIGLATVAAQSRKPSRQGLAFRSLTHLLKPDHLVLLHRPDSLRLGFQRAFRDMLLSGAEASKGT